MATLEKRLLNNAERIVTKTTILDNICGILNILCIEDLILRRNFLKFVVGLVSFITCLTELS